MKKKTVNEQRYTVSAKLSVDDIPKSGAAATFKVNEGGKLVGYVQIGQGSFRWKGKNGRSYKTIPWTQFFAKLDGG